MSYYHVIVSLKSRPHRGAIEENLLEQDLMNIIVKPYNKGEPFKCGDTVVNRDDISYIKITESERILGRDHVFVSPQNAFANLWHAISQQEDVTDKFLKTISHRKKETVKEITPFSKNKVFIVHGRDHEPMKELKEMLYDFGLKPIVLHEQPSGSRTIVEKLEKYSDVGYAFVILTPDDVGCLRDEFRINTMKFLAICEDSRKVKQAINSFKEIVKTPKQRARQNVVLEFGYFMGLLGRDRVCCLLKGDVEKPSDMHGIVYIPFNDSVEEVRVKVMKELMEAGYEIKM